MWRMIDAWLLSNVVSYLDEGDVYRLWVFAEEQRLEPIRDYLTTDFDDMLLSETRALHLAMGYACWTAVRRLTKESGVHHLPRSTVHDILDEIQRRVKVPLPQHPDRETAMMTAAAPGSVPPFVMYFAVRQGNLESVIWLHSVSRYDPTEALRVAARHGHDHVISWLLDNAATARWIIKDCSVEWVFRYEDDPELGVLAWRVTYQGKSSVSTFTNKWGLHSNVASLGSPSQYDVLDLVVMNGDLESLQRLVAYDVFKSRDPARTINVAALAGHLHVVRWLYEHAECNAFSEETIHAASIEKREEGTVWAVAQVKDLRGLCPNLSGLLRMGHLDVLRWVADTFPSTMKLGYIPLRRACDGGHLAIVRWLVDEHGIRISQQHLADAASSGHKEVFQWLLERLERDHGSTTDWDPRWLDCAAKSGDLSFVRWLVEDCGMWSPSALASATSCDVAEYLHAFGLLQKLPYDLSTVQRKDMLQDGSWEVVAWLLKQESSGKLFEQSGLDRIHYFEWGYALTQKELGWKEYVPLDGKWPRTSEAMARLRKMVRDFIELYDPQFVRRITWLPKWATQHGTIASLERLAAIGHRNIRIPRTFGELLGNTKQADKVQWFLTKEPTLYSLRVVKWAVQHDRRRFLPWLVFEFLPAREIATGSNRDAMVLPCVHHTLWMARNHGRTEIEAWVLAQFPCLTADLAS